MLNCIDAHTECILECSNYFQVLNCCQISGHKFVVANISHELHPHFSLCADVTLKVLSLYFYTLGVLMRTMYISGYQRFSYH